MTLDEKIKRIAKETRKLTATSLDRPTARRNARARVLSALRAVRAHIDVEFPAIVSREGVKRLTVDGRRARLKRQGFVKVGEPIAGDYALAGVSVRTVTVRNPQRDGDTIRWNEHYVPRWATIIAPAKLRAAAKDRGLRDALLAEHALRNS